MDRKNRHPIRKCGKCKLNLRTECGLFDNPREQWNTHRKCPGYMSEAHYERYLARQRMEAERRVQKPRTFVRQEEARMARTAQHNDGVVNIGIKDTG
ncbi:MAG TPA: hypothetical protein PLP01_02795 [Phycisphaerae bacterium]|nr:hypothetical protein [Phycisphaerae bacterium]HOI54155.1 hypothetical protein [Phycisphaerae bacterium]